MGWAILVKHMPADWPNMGWSKLFHHYEFKTQNNFSHFYAKNFWWLILEWSVSVPRPTTNGRKKLYFSVFGQSSKFQTNTLSNGWDSFTDHSFLYPNPGSTGPCQRKNILGTCFFAQMAAKKFQSKPLIVYRVTSQHLHSLYKWLKNFYAHFFKHTYSFLSQGYNI